MGDRQATRRHEKPLLWDRLPYAATPLYSSQDLAAQRDKVRHCTVSHYKLSYQLYASSWRYGVKTA